MIILLFALLAQMAPPGMVVADLAASPDCTSRVELRNLGSAPAAVLLEARLDTGALVPLEKQGSIDFKLAPGERREFAVSETGPAAKAWVKLSGESQSVAFSGAVECIEGDRLRSVSRPAAYSMRDPWFEIDSADYRGAEVLIVNTAARPALANACYSGGALFSVPSANGPPPPLQPVCLAAREIRIPPYSAARLPVERESTTHFALRTIGEAVVIQPLRPFEGSAHLFSVDSTIRFQMPVKIVK